VPQHDATLERADCMVALADLLEAGVLTSDRPPEALLSEAQQLYRGLNATLEAERLQRRLKAMTATGEHRRQTPVPH
ncbi:MAG: hypothetical protein HY902_11050, partial [Deltaproteobacteria bacterium]|nr:hypothetical protein [Deltaproteobacteria bacterium]